MPLGISFLPATWQHPVHSLFSTGLTGHFPFTHWFPGYAIFLYVSASRRLYAFLCFISFVALRLRFLLPFDPVLSPSIFLTVSVKLPPAPTLLGFVLRDYVSGLPDFSRCFWSSVDLGFQVRFEGNRPLSGKNRLHAYGFSFNLSDSRDFGKKTETQIFLLFRFSEAQCLNLF